MARKIIRMAFFALTILLVSCSRSKKIADKNEFGKIIFELLNEQDKSTLENYLVSKSEIAEAFKENKNYSSLSAEEKKN